MTAPARPRLDDAYPMSRVQAGMVFHSEYAPESDLYHNIDSFHLRGRFEPRLLRAAAQQLAARHPVLRTSFDLAGYSEPIQLVHHEVAIPFEVEDLSQLDPAARERAIDSFMRAEQARHFSWSSAPLARLVAHCRGPDEFQLTLTSHHAVLDGWSVSSLVYELLRHYHDLLRDPHAPPPPAPAASVRDFVALEREAIASPQARSFWQEYLRDASATRLPRWPIQDIAGRAGVPARELPVPAATSARLLALASALRVPLKSVLLAAHLQVLGALAGAEEILTGLVGNGRPETGDGHRTLGVFLNVLPLRLRLGRGSWRQLIGRVFAAECELLQHRRYPLADLQQLAGGGALFETTFNFIHFHVMDALAELDGLELVEERYFQETNFPFAVSFGLDTASRDRPPGIQLLTAYSAREFPDEQIAEIERRYLAVLDAIAADPDARYGPHAVMDEAERALVLVDWNRTAGGYPVACAHALFEAQAARRPDAVAASFDGATLSYRELNRRANRLARRLQALGARPEARVGIFVDRSFDLLVAVLAVLKSGAAYVPLDPTLPDQRLAYMLADAGAELAVTWPHLAGRLGTEVTAVHPEDPDEPPAGPGDDTNPDSGVAPRNLAYVIYTSGSTGQPKGVAIEHRSICNFTNTTISLFEVDHRDRILQFASIGFDVSVFEIFTALHAGARVCLLRQDSLLELDELTSFLQEQKVTVMDMPPALMALLDGTDFPHLRIAFVGGEAFSGDLVNRWALPGRRFVNGYGPTESTVTMTAMECEGWHTASPPIGRPLPNHRVYLLDRDLEPVPVGAAGELCIGGVGLARCYHRRPGLTAERFVPDPFGEEPGGRLYRSGDLARYRPDGAIEFLGRIDDQVKLRGLRIELGEVVWALESHERVRQAAVEVREGDGAARRLVAYVVAQGVTGPQLRAWLAERLPAYMLPSRYQFLERLPLTPSGKLNRDALPPLEREEPGAHPAVLPRTPLEELLCVLFGEVLGVDRLGVHDDFFDLGGNSLLATQLVARVREAFQVRLELRRLFEGPTVAQLAEAVEEEPGGREAVARVVEALAALPADALQVSDQGGHK